MARTADEPMVPKSKPPLSSPRWTICEPCGSRLPGWPCAGQIAKAKGVGKVAGEVVREAEAMFWVVEGQRPVADL